MINQNEEIYLTKSDKLSDEANIESWFDPFDLRGILAIIAVIGFVGTVLAVYTVTQSKKLKNLIATMFVSTHIPLVNVEG
jgi:hypothetical protein